jgi:uncharacterized protein YaeQ
VALTATVYAFAIELSHVDRGLYETLTFRAAQHPSETDDFLLARVLAYCLEYADGIQFSAQGLSGPDEPPLAIREAQRSTGSIRDVGKIVCHRGSVMRSTVPDSEVSPIVR